MRIFHKTRTGNTRKIYLCGFKIFEYKRREKLTADLIDKEKIQQDIQLFPIGESGLATESRNPRLIVSLTSYPERMSEIHFSIYSLLKQKTKPDMLIL